MMLTACRSPLSTARLQVKQRPCEDGPSVVIGPPRSVGDGFRGGYLAVRGRFSLGGRADAHVDWMPNGPGDTVHIRWRGCFDWRQDVEQGLDAWSARPEYANHLPVSGPRNVVSRLQAVAIAGLLGHAAGRAALAFPPRECGHAVCAIERSSGVEPHPHERMQASVDTLHWLESSGRLRCRDTSNATDHYVSATSARRALEALARATKNAPQSPDPEVYGRFDRFRVFGRDGVRVFYVGEPAYARLDAWWNREVVPIDALCRRRTDLP
ncbi:MAG: hypothetical protein AAF938_05500 [Myxococcota bacterium]